MITGYVLIVDVAQQFIHHLWFKLLICNVSAIKKMALLKNELYYRSINYVLT